MSVTVNYLTQLKDKKIEVKVYLNDPKAMMLTGIITDFDEDAIILGQCLIPRESILSITPPIKK